MIIKDYTEIDGIKIFDKDIDENHKDYNSKDLDTLYSQEEKHFWFLSRKNFILQNFVKYIDKNSKIIEIGAGTGNVSKNLQFNGYKNISVGEMHSNGLKYARNYGIRECFQFNLLDSPFKKEFDVVCMFDVLEHIENDNLALQNVNKMLKEKGKIVLTVPCHMWLWNRDDNILGHKVRYTKKELLERLQENGFKILTARYFFITIIPILFLRAIINKDDGSKIKDEEYTRDISINPLISKILLFICNVENKINKFLPNIFGGSLFIIAEKNI